MINYFIDKQGEIAFEISGYENIQKFSNGLASVSKIMSISDYEQRGLTGKRGSYGYINKTGTVAIEPQYFYARTFSGGLAVVQTAERGFFRQPDNDWGIIDEFGHLIYEENWDILYDLSEDTAIARKGEILTAIDSTGKRLFSVDNNEITLEFRGNQKFSDGLIVGYDVKADKCGFLNKEREFVIEPKFANAANFAEGLARVSIKRDHREYLGFINPEGEYVLEPKFDIDSDFLRCTNDFSEGLAGLIGELTSIERDQSFMFIDQKGEIAIKTDFFRAECFHEGLAAVWDSKSQKSGYLDKSGSLVIPLKYDLAGDFSEGLASVGVGLF